VARASMHIVSPAGGCSSAFAIGDIVMDKASREPERCLREVVEDDPFFNHPLWSATLVST
jgi:hypothetical protein